MTMPNFEALLTQVGNAIRIIKEKHPDPEQVGEGMPNEQLIAYHSVQVATWIAQAKAADQLAREKSDAGEVALARALFEWGERMRASAKHFESPEYKEWLASRQKGLDEESQAKGENDQLVMEAVTPTSTIEKRSWVGRVLRFVQFR